MKTLILFCVSVIAATGCSSNQGAAAVGTSDTPAATSDGGPDPGSTNGSANGADASTAVFAYPAGCYTSADALSPVPAAVLQNPGLVGVAISEDWAHLEGAGDNMFDWSGFDARIAEVEARGKKVVLGITASAAKAPAWLYADPSVATMQIDDPNPDHGTTGKLTVAMFWDPTFAAQKLELLRAVGARYSSDPNIIGVMQGFANYYTNDWGIPLDMKSGGYSYDAMIQVGHDVITTVATAFPNQAIKLPIGQNDPAMDPDKTTTQMADDILAFAKSAPFYGRFFAQKNLINTQSLYATDPALATIDPSSNSYLLRDLRDMAPHEGLQMVSAAEDGPRDGCRQNAHVSPCDDVAGVLAKSIDISLSYKPTYLEFWTADASDPSLYSQFEGATTAMQSW